MSCRVLAWFPSSRECPPSGGHSEGVQLLCSGSVNLSYFFYFTEISRPFLVSRWYTFLFPNIFNRFMHFLYFSFFKYGVLEGTRVRLS